MKNMIDVIQNDKALAFCVCADVEDITRHTNYHTFVCFWRLDIPSFKYSFKEAKNWAGPAIATFFNN